MGFLELGYMLVLAAASMILSELLRPKVAVENARPAGLGDFNFPTAVEGRPVPVAWGTVKIDGANVVWYGDLRQVPRVKKMKTGLWSSQSFVQGYKYDVGVQLALCKGRIDAVRRAWVGDTQVWSGSVQDGTFDVNEPELFGGDDLGSGGMVGTFRVHSGSATQAVNAYLSAHQDPLPAYRGTCYLVWEGGYVGNSTSLKPWKFEVSRFPNGLGLTSSRHIVNTYDANPACVLYEILTNTEWGFGFSSADVDVANLQAVGNTLYSEGNGISILLDKVMEAGEFIRELERQIGGVMYLDPATGQFKVNLTRGGYDVDLVPQVTSANCCEIVDWAPGSWESVANEVRVGFADRARDYFETFAEAKSVATQKAQGKVEPATIRYPGVKDGALANQIACREIRERSRPLAKATVRVDRKFWNLHPGDVVAWTDDTLGHVKLPMRVSRISLGTLADGKVELNLIQDVFEYAPGFSSAPPATGWSAPTQAVGGIPADEVVAIEAPRALTRRDPNYPDVVDRLWCGGRQASAGACALRAYQRNASGVPSGAYALSGEVADFLATGKLKTALAAGGANPGSVEVEADEDTVATLLAAFDAASSAGSVGQHLVNLIMIDSEFLACVSVTNSTTYLTLNFTYRGMLDSAPADHAIGAKVYVLRGDLMYDTITPGYNVHAQVRQLSRTDESTEGESATVSLTMANRTLRPYPPVELAVNGARYPAAPTYDAMKTGGTTLDDRGYEVTFLRRDFRTYDEVAGITIDAATLDATFPAANSTQYRAEAIDDPDGTPTSLAVTAWNAGAALLFVSRTKILRAMAGVKPATMRLEVETRHAVSGTTYEALQASPHDFAPGASTLDDDANWGLVPFGTISPTWAAPVTGTYTFNIGTAMPSGAVQARINGGSWQTVIAAGNVTGTLAGVTASDTIEVQHLSNTGTATETFLEAVAPSGTVNAYAIMVY